MVLLITPSIAQRKLADHLRARRLALEWTQKELALRSGVPLPTLRKFEQKGIVSLESFLKLTMVLGGLEQIVEAIAPESTPFTSIEEVLKEPENPPRKRGRRA
jgi:transcriptional regulator with XRE-family HTH domain